MTLVTAPKWYSVSQGPLQLADFQRLTMILSDRPTLYSGKVSRICYFGVSKLRSQAELFRRSYSRPADLNERTDYGTASPERRDSGQPKSMQFAHFGVLNDGYQSKASTMTAVLVNVALAFVIVVIGAATKKSIDNRLKLTELAAPIPIKKSSPSSPRSFRPSLGEIFPTSPRSKSRSRRSSSPQQVKLPDIPKPVAKMDEAEALCSAPVAPKQVVAMAAPAVVNLKAAAHRPWSTTPRIPPRSRLAGRITPSPPPPRPARRA